MTFEARWFGVETTLNTTTLTENETIVMIAMRNNEYSDIYVSGSEWNKGVCEESELTSKVYRGVVSSLIKKGYVKVFEGMKFEESTISLTYEGKILYGNETEGKEYFGA
jgi:hypothetical protein